jgi:YidC/Oxa1 family membrane protein insertase
MDQKRLILAIAISVAILIGFQWLLPHPPPPPPAEQQQAQQTTPPKPPSAAPSGAGAVQIGAEGGAPKHVPRVRIDAPSVAGSVSLLGARIDDLVLKNYHETVSRASPLVRLLEPRSDAQPYYVQYGWTTPAGETVKLPGNDTVWTASAPELTPGHPVILSWDNGQGLTFEIQLAIDDHYMFSVEQRVRNAGTAPVTLFPWARVRRDYTPESTGMTSLYGGVAEGLIGVTNGTLHGMTYESAKSKGEKEAGVAYQATSTGGWSGITDKYWLAALIPDQAIPSKVDFTYVKEGGDHYQVGYVATAPEVVRPGAQVTEPSHVFVGAKVISVLDQYQAEYHIPLFSRAVDFGWLYLLSTPIFYCLDWLNHLLGNFGLAIIAFTTCVKALFFPLANYSYRSMSKMKLLAPKMTALRERYKDEPQRMQQEMMALYRTEKVNPASGCLPMLVQIPVFISLYVVIYTTIEMRHAPFFGWIQDLSAIDPTNVFNMFGLLPFDPGVYSHFLHLGAWPLIMGFTMYLQQVLNPPPPDPMQAKLFKLMPIIFTFMLANFPAGLVIYWTWNNLLSVTQQWLIMRRTRLTRPGLART